MSVINIAKIKPDGSGGFTIDVLDPSIESGAVGVFNDSGLDLWVGVRLTYGAGADDYYQVSGNPNNGDKLRVGVLDTVTSVTVYAATTAPGSDDWSGLTQVSRTLTQNLSSTITIAADGTITDPLGSSASPGNVTVSSGQVTVVNGSDQDYNVFGSSTDSSFDTVPSRATCTFEVGGKTMLLFSTSSSATPSDPTVIIRNIAKSVVCVYYDDQNQVQAAYPAMIQPDASTMIYVVNLADGSAKVSISGIPSDHSGGWEQQVDTIEVAPLGGVYAAEVDFDFTRPTWLSWDVTGDPKVVIMPPSRPPS